MPRILLAALLPVLSCLAACDLRPSDNPPNEATALLRDPHNGYRIYCQADFWSPDTTRVDECVRRNEALGYVLVRKNYVTSPLTPTGR